MKTVQKGFTLIELLVVIGILAVLLAITLIAINPSRQFGQANDTKRRSDATQLLNAVGQYVSSNQGNLPAELQTLRTGSPGVVTRINDANFDTLCAELAGDYLPAVPTDPTLNTSAGLDDAACAVANWDTGYSVAVDANGRVTILAPLSYSQANAGPTIGVTR